MVHLVLICSFAAVLAANGTVAANAAQDTWCKDRLACAAVGIDPGSAAFNFNQCVADLHHSLWAEDNLCQY